MCGENARRREKKIRPRGSPPRVRGKPPECLQNRDGHRITPACAGKTRQAIRVFKPREDHPRVCGENAPYFVKFASPGGSPPRVRGKRDDISVIFDLVRITPACAGKTRMDWMNILTVKDHPRVCGENLPPSARLFILKGSPPRVRGKPE